MDVLSLAILNCPGSRVAMYLCFGFLDRSCHHVLTMESGVFQGSARVISPCVSVAGVSSQDAVRCCFEALLGLEA
eukprot:4729989-Pyramimonas_sp.AAC.1